MCLCVFHPSIHYLSTSTNTNPSQLPSMHASICPPAHSYLLSLPIHLANYPLIHSPIHLLVLHIYNCSLPHSTMHLSLCTYSLLQSHAHSPIHSSTQHTHSSTYPHIIYSYHLTTHTDAFIHLFAHTPAHPRVCVCVCVCVCVVSLIDLSR